MRCVGEVSVTGDARSLRAARHLADQLDAHPDLLRGDVALLVSELTTNAHLHGEPPITVRVLTDDDVVRIEVTDAGAALPVRPLPSTEAMTGRGLALVDTLAHAWGVDAVEDGGKTIWAEVRGTDAAEQDAAGWAAGWLDHEPIDPAQELHTIHLGAVPTQLLLEAKSHIDDVVRELSLVQASTDSGDVLPPPLQALVVAVTQDFAPARGAIKRQALASAARGETVTELTLHLPVSAAAAGERYLAALEEVDRQSRSGRMLTLAPPRSHRTFRRWYIQALVDQLRAVAAGETATAPPPFPQVLAAQVDELAALLETQSRLRLLQTLTRRLAEAKTVTEMAQVTVDMATEYDGVEAARVFLLTDGQRTLRSIAWHGRVEEPAAFDEFRVDDDLPGAEAVRTRQPYHARAVSDLHERFPEFAQQSPYSPDHSLHGVPLTVAGHVNGLLGLFFRPGEVPDDVQVEFVTAIADALAQAMERALAHERAEAEQQRELALLAAQADALVGVVSGRRLVDVLDRLLLAVEAANRDGMLASVLLVDDDGRHLRHGAAPSLPADYNAAVDGIAIAESTGSCGTAAHRRERVVVEDVSVDPLWRDFRELAAAAGLRACWSTPIVGGDGTLLGTFAMYYRRPHRPTDSDLAFVDVLVGTVGLIIERSRSQSGTPPLTDEAAERLALEVAVNAGGVGTFDWNLETGELVWDEQLLRIFYRSPEEGRSLTIEEFYDAVHPNDRRRVGEALRQAIDSIGEFESEYRIVLRDGSTKWVGARGRALAGPHGTATRFIGAAYDTTARRDSDTRVARVMDSMATAFFFLDREWRFTFLNAEAERVLGRGRDVLLGRVVWEEFPAALGSDFERFYRGAAATGEPVAFDAYYPDPLNAWYEVRAWPSPDGLAVYFIDVTDRRFAEDAARRAISRAGLLAKVSEELARTDDPRRAMRSLAELVVPELGEWCIVTLIGDDRHAGTRRGLGEAFGWHPDPALRDQVQEYAQTRLAMMTDDALVVRAVETADPQFVNDVAMDTLRAMFDPGSKPLQILEDLDAASIAALPLVGQERPVGMLSLVNSRARGPFTAEEQELLREVAARAGLVLDRARLYRQQREVAEGLQRSMLRTPAPQPHLQIAVRYVAAAEAAQVGGDWYDSFDVDGATVLVIGDVMGHDVSAAAAMGETRTLVRALAAQHGGDPARALDAAEQVMHRLRLDTLATVLVGRLTRGADGSTLTLGYANAGHPPPLVADRDGHVEVLAAGVDPLLGVGTGGHSEQQAALAPGALLVLYTDGLVERRGQSIDDGIRRLVATLEDVHEHDPEQVADEVLSRLLPARPEDDVALLVVRVAPAS